MKGARFLVKVRGLWSLRAVPRGPFYLTVGVQVSHPGPASWGMTCAAA